MSKQQLTLEQKVQKVLPDFANEVQALTDDQINARLAQLAKDAEEIQQAQEADEDLEQLKFEASEAVAPYRHGKKMVNLKSRYLISILNGRGK